MVLELKSDLRRSLYEWVATLYGHSFTSFEEFLDFCHFTYTLLLPLVHFLCIEGAFIFLKKIIIDPKKKKKTFVTMRSKLDAFDSYI